MVVFNTVVTYKLGVDLHVTSHQDPSGCLSNYLVADAVTKRKPGNWILKIPGWFEKLWFSLPKHYNKNKPFYLYRNAENDRLVIITDSSDTCSFSKEEVEQFVTQMFLIGDWMQSLKNNTYIIHSERMLLNSCTQLYSLT